jgi:ComF family protein
VGERGADRGVAGRLAGLLCPALDALAAVVFAPACVACDRLLDHPTRGPVCEPCWHSIAPLPGPLCEQCGDALPSWRAAAPDSARCARCRRGAPSVVRARAIGAYDGALRAIIHALKYDGRRSVARRLAGLMRERGGAVLEGADCAVPVPLHRSRLRQRGFNQAADLARHLGVPVVHAAVRVRATSSQASLPAAQRHGNVRDAFAPVRTRPPLAGSVLVLIDDVATTGATLDACARALASSGVREVRALTAARAVSVTR